MEAFINEYRHKLINMENIHTMAAAKILYKMMVPVLPLHLKYHHDKIP